MQNAELRKLKKILRKLMTHKDETVRIATVLSLAEGGHDDFLPHIRRMMSHHGPAQQEACATALGVLKDENSAKSFMVLTKSSNPNVKLAALASLYRLGRHETINDVAAMANQGNLFAITVLGNMPGSEEVLAKLLQNDQLQIKINAAAALLNLGDKRSLPIIGQLLLRDSRDIALGKISSQGMSLNALKVVPSAQQNFEDDPVGIEISSTCVKNCSQKPWNCLKRNFYALHMPSWKASKAISFQPFLKSWKTIQLRLSLNY